jgi:type VI secretion system protein ImpC
MLYRALVEEAAEDAIEGAAEERWSMLVADYAFGSGDDDANLLQHLARLAATIDSPLVAGVDFSQLQSVSNEPWQALRHAAEAAFLALVWPRFLLRLPYGADSKPIDAFNFEEVRESDSPPQLLWGNSAYLLALLLGQAFGEAAPGAPLHSREQVDGLPVWMRKRDGVAELHPCGERLITDSMAEQLQTLGITPLISIRDRDVVCLPQWISLSGGKLRGRWLNTR